MREISQNKTKAWVFILAGLQERNNNNQRDPKIVYVVDRWSLVFEVMKLKTGYLYEWFIILPQDPFINRTFHKY